MKNFGQISFDLMFAVLIALVTIQAFLPLVEDISWMQNEAGIRSQERAIARDIARVMKTAQETGVSVDYKIPEIYVAGLRTGIGCDVGINLAGDEITVRVDQLHYPELGASETIEEKILTKGLTTGSFVCGQQATIS